MQTIAQLKTALVIINQLEKSNRSTKVKKMTVIQVEVHFQHIT